MKKGNLVRTARATHAHGYAPKDHPSAWISCNTPVGEGLQGVVVRCVAAGRTAVKDGRPARLALAFVDFGTMADGVAQVIAVAKADLVVMINHRHYFTAITAPIQGREDDYPEAHRVTYRCKCGAIQNMTEDS